MMPSPSRPAARRTSGAPADRDGIDRRAALARQIKRRATVSWWLGVVLAIGFAAIVTPAITAERWLLGFHAGTATEPGTVAEHHVAPFTVRAPMLAGGEHLRIGGGVVVARGETANRDEATIADTIAGATPHGPVLYGALFMLLGVLATLFTHHMRRSTKGRLVRVQIVSLVVLAVLAVAAKIVMLSTALSALAVPVAALALIPTMVLDRIVGLATGVLAALVISLLAPFDVGLAILLLVQAASAGLVVAERPRRRWLAALTAGLVTTLCTSATYLLLTYLTTGHAPELRDPLHSPWLAATIGPSLAALVAVPLIPLYQLLVGEITQGKLFALEDLGHPLLRQIAEKSPGTWQHSLMMANMAEIAANEIGASGRLVRVGAYFHDLGKSLQAKYFIENLEAGETSPHDQLPPEVSCEAIFAHVTEGIVSARKAGLHERIVDFMHMHHGNGVLEYFWEKCREQGNPHDLTVDDFRYPGHPPQSRETAILAICDAVEAASRTLKKPDPAAIDALVQRIVYGKLHLGQLDESGLSMSDLRRISDSLRETIRHANHGRIEYPWQKAGQDASASVTSYPSTSPRLDSLDRRPGRDSARRPQTSLPASPPASSTDAAFAATADVGNPASEQRIPIARGTLPDAEPDAVVKIRAGTRNTHPSSPPTHTPGGDTSRAASQAEPLPAWLGAGSRRGDSAADFDAGFEIDRRDSGAAPGDSGALNPAGAGRSTDRGAMSIADAVPRLIREVPITLTGRAPGPLPPPPDPIAALTMDREPPPPALTFDNEPPPPALTFDNDPPPAVLTFDNEPPPAALTFDNEPPPAALTFDNDPLPVAQVLEAKLPSTTQIFGSEPQPSGSEPPRQRAATGSPAQARPPTAPPPLASRRATGDLARTAGPPAPVDLDNAITNPPPLRRGPSGHPAVPSDPAQLAASLANTVSRGTSAPPSAPRPPEEAPRTGPRHADLDNAITNPPPPGKQVRTAARHTDLDNAITNPPPPGKQARTVGPRSELDGAFTDPPASLGSPHADPEPIVTSRAPLRAPVGSTSLPPIDLDAPIAPQAPLGAPARTDLPHADPEPPLSPPAPPSTADLADSAVTMPSMSSAPARPTDVDIAVAVPAMASALAPASVAAAPPELDPAADPFPVPDERARPPSSPPLRTSGLADDDAGSREIVTLPGHGGAPQLVTIRPPASPSGAHPELRSATSMSDAQPEPRPTAAPPDAQLEPRPREATPGAPTIIRPRASTAEARPANRLALLLEDEARVTAARAAAKLRFRDQARVTDETRTTDETRATAEARVTDETRIPGDAHVTDRVRSPDPVHIPDEARVTDEQRTVPDPDLDAGVTEPSLPLLAVGDALRVDLPLPPVPAAGPQSERKAGWASGLAARIDAALDSDEWNLETPVVPPTKAELRALLGQPDPTRRQPVDEIAMLQRHALELDEPDLLPRRAPHPTTEVDPDDIEAAIEIAPPVRRPPNAKALGVAKPKKSE